MRRRLLLRRLRRRRRWWLYHAHADAHAGPVAPHLHPGPDARANARAQPRARADPSSDAHPHAGPDPCVPHTLPEPTTVLHILCTGTESALLQQRNDT